MREHLSLLVCGSFFYILRIKLHIKLVLFVCFPLALELYTRQECYSVGDVNFICLHKEDVYVKEKNDLVRRQAPIEQWASWSVRLDFPTKGGAGDHVPKA